MQLTSPDTEIQNDDAAADLVCEESVDMAKQPVVLTGLWGWIADRLGIPPWGQLLILALIAIFGLIGTGFFFGFSALTKIDHHLVIIDTRLGLQSGTELLGSVNTYVDQGERAKAVEATQTAKSFIFGAKAHKLPAPPGYFEKTINLLNQIKLSDPQIINNVFSTRVALAEYRSVLQPKPEFPKRIAELEPKTPLSSSLFDERAVFLPKSPFVVKPDLVVLGANNAINGIAIPPGTDLLQVPGTRFSENRMSIQALTLFNVTQTLDGIEWKNVVFFNAHIKYGGGDLILENVRFVNCTFDVPVDMRGAEFADYVALEENRLKIG